MTDDGAGRRVFAFFGLAYAISWACWVAGAWLGTAAWPVLSTLGGFGPLLAGAILSHRAGRLRGWAAQAVRWRVGARLWVVALVGAPLLSLLGTGLYAAATGTTPAIVSGPVQALAIFATVLLLRGGFGEELGWRGYALPALLGRYTTATAALLVGVGWAGWHLPLFAIGGTRQTGPFALYLLAVVGLSVLLAWVYVRAGGSVLLTAVVHAGWNVADRGPWSRSGRRPARSPPRSRPPWSGGRPPCCSFSTAGRCGPATPTCVCGSVTKPRL